MKDKKKKSSISRRNFMKGLGTGVVGSSVMLGTLRAVPMPMEEASSQAEDEARLVPLVLTVNGKAVRLKIEPQTTLAELLRERLQLTGTKVVCNQGECGACTVLLDGKAVYSCHTLALDAAGKEVITIEGLMNGEELHPLQQAFIDKDGMQCGFCTPGQIMAAEALLQKYPKPDRQQMLSAMSGNICRCAAYPKIIDSVLEASRKRS